MWFTANNQKPRRQEGKRRMQPLKCFDIINWPKKMQLTEHCLLQTNRKCSQPKLTDTNNLQIA